MSVVKLQWKEQESKQIKYCLSIFAWSMTVLCQYLCQHNPTEISFFWHSGGFYIQLFLCLAVCYKNKVMWCDVKVGLSFVKCWCFREEKAELFYHQPFFLIQKKVTGRRKSTFSQQKTCIVVRQEGMWLLHGFMSSGWKNMPDLLTLGPISVLACILSWNHLLPISVKKAAWHSYKTWEFC